MKYDTVTEAVRVAREILAELPADWMGYDIVWAGSERILEDAYRQSCLERGK